MDRRTDPAVEDLRLRWRDLTMRSVWRHHGDWDHPAVDALIETLAMGADPVGAARRLGAVRSRTGASITETIDDVACLYRALDAEPPLDVIRELSAGWSLERETNPGEHTCIDPISGLFNADYFSARLRETYNTAHLNDTTANTTHGLLVIDAVLTTERGPFGRSAEGGTTIYGPLGGGADREPHAGGSPVDLATGFKRSVLLGDLLRNLFGPGYPCAALDNGLFVVLLERGEKLGERLAAIRRALDRSARRADDAGAALRQPPRMWIEPLPQTIREFRTMLSELRRSD